MSEIGRKLAQPLVAVLQAIQHVIEGARQIDDFRRRLGEVKTLIQPEKGACASDAHAWLFVPGRQPPQQPGPGAQAGPGREITDLGWKDTILVWPGETVRIATDFTNTSKGDQLYLFHCHNLEHEDQGMMVNLLVTAV